ncbi:TPA: YicC/YloC family endoribonuclease [Escherichia coli]
MDIEIKSVNQRFLDVQIRSPKILNFIENDFRQLIKQQLKEDFGISAKPIAMFK